MEKNGVFIPVRWLLLTVIFIAPILGSDLRETFIAGIKTDHTGISSAIGILFLVGMLNSFWQMMVIFGERRSLTRLQHNVGNIDKLKENGGNSESLGISIFRLRSKGHAVKVEALVESLHTKIFVRGSMADTLSGVLITLGLIGTIVGLIGAISGIDEVIKNVGVSNQDMMIGLKHTMSGMGTAFYTTLYGSVLGGIILKIMQGHNAKILSNLCADLVDFFELQLIPGCVSGNNLEKGEALGSIDSMGKAMATFAEQLSRAGHEMEELMNIPIYTRLEKISKDLQECVAGITKAKQDKKS